MGYMEEYRKWMESPALTAEEHAELAALEGNEKEIQERFFAPLSFGTAGLRGTMGIGLYKMNRFTVGAATQGLANLIKQYGPRAMQRGVAIACDSRLHSDEYSHLAASILAANGINVIEYESLRPVPVLSFAVRTYGTLAGVMVTASHNPKEYNGYKVYWEDGAQLPPKEADVVAKEMDALDMFTDVKTMDHQEAIDKGLIKIVGPESDEIYLRQIQKMSINPDCIAQVADDFKIIYTPFHGAGYKLVPEALHRLGITELYPVPEQMVLDGNFSTVESPNPENPEGFYLAVDLAKKVGSDLIIGTDPDSDRIGVMVRSGDEYISITGNQLGCLLLDYVINARRATGTMPENPGAMASIVSDRKSTRLNSSHSDRSRMPSSA